MVGKAHLLLGDLYSHSDVNYLRAAQHYKMAFKTENGPKLFNSFQQYKYIKALYNMKKYQLAKETILSIPPSSDTPLYFHKVIYNTMLNKIKTIQQRKADRPAKTFYTTSKKLVSNRENIA